MFRRHCEGKNIYLIRKKQNLRKKGQNGQKNRKKGQKGRKSRRKNFTKIRKKVSQLRAQAIWEGKIWKFLRGGVSCYAATKVLFQGFYSEKYEILPDFSLFSKIFGDLGHVTTSAVFPILSSFIKSDQTENRSTLQKVMGQNLKRFLFSGYFKM